MKKKVYRERYRTVVLGTEKPEIIPYNEGGLTLDKNGEIKEVRVSEKLKAGAEEQARMLLEASLKETDTQDATMQEVEQENAEKQENASNSEQETEESKEVIN